MNLQREKTSADDSPLKGHYFRQVFFHLSTIKLSLETLKENPAATQPVRRITCAAETISDLAMIHGYEGVEKTAHKIAAILCRLQAAPTPVDHAVLDRIDQAVKVLRQIAELEDSVEQEMTVEKTHEQAEQTHEHVKQFHRQLSHKFDFLRHRQLELFDHANAANTQDAPATSGPSDRDEDAPFWDIHEAEEVLAMEKTLKAKNSTLDLFAPDQNST